MKKQMLVVLAVIAFLAAAAPAFAQESNDATRAANINAYVELLRADLRAKRVAIITEVMVFDEAEAEAFWPIYKEYEAELSKLGDEKVEGIKEYARVYADLTDEKADELARLVLSLEGRRTEMKKKYYEKVKKAIGGKNAARWLQVENQLLMIVDLQIASGLPTVQ